MRHYIMFTHVSKGTGDYGSDIKCVHDGKISSERNALDFALRYAHVWDSEIDVFRGKRIGRFWKTIQKGEEK